MAMPADITGNTLKATVAHTTIGTVGIGKADATITGLTGITNKKVGPRALPRRPCVHRRPFTPPPPPRSRSPHHSPTRAALFPYALTPTPSDLFAIANQLDAQATAQLQSVDQRIAAHSMAQGSLTSARNPSAAITARYPAARQHVAALDACVPIATPPSTLAVPPTLADGRREGMLASRPRQRRRRYPS